jgi:uncharacterized RDD family membrane protein YckC
VRHREGGATAPLPPHAEAAPASAETYARRSDQAIVIRRWLACVLDYILLAGLLPGAALVLTEDLYQYTLVIRIMIALAYFPVLEGFLGWTVGKLVFVIRVVDENGDNPGLKKALGSVPDAVSRAESVFVLGLPGTVGRALLRDETATRRHAGGHVRLGGGRTNPKARPNAEGRAAG